MKEEHPNNPPFRRVAAKCALFLALVVAIGAVLQTILRHKWSPYVENVSTRYQALMEEPAGTIDVLYLGSSPLYAAVNPAVIWNESGVTGYNLGLSNQNAMTVYYELQYLLKHHTPQVVCIDANSIVSDRTPENEEYETTYRKVVDAIPDLGVKAAFIRDICRTYDDQHAYDYWLPLFRYHDRWSELSCSDFSLQTEDIYYQYFSKGCLLEAGVEAQIWPSVYPLQDDTIDPADGAVEQEYYNRIVRLCRENGIQVAVILPPHLGLTQAKYDAVAAFSAENDLPLLAYPTEESWLADGFDLDTDLYEWNHLNIYGQAKFSAIVADCLQEWFGLEDHRGDPAYAAWDEAYAEYLDFFAQAEAALAEGPAEEELPAA